MYDAYLLDEIPTTYDNLASGNLNSYLSSVSANFTKDVTNLSVLSLSEDPDFISSLPRSQQISEVRKELEEDEDLVYPRPTEFEKEGAIVYAPYGIASVGYMKEIMNFEQLSVSWLDDYLKMPKPDIHGVKFISEIVSEVQAKNIRLLVLSDYLRLARLMTGSVDRDNNTNEMSKMFPDYHAYYHYLNVFKDFYPKNVKDPVIVTTNASVSSIIQTVNNYGEDWSLKTTVVGLPEDVLPKIRELSREKLGDAISFFMDLNTEVFDTDQELEGVYGYSRRWMSAIRTNVRQRERNYAILYSLASAMQAGYVSGVLVLPLLTDPGSLELLFNMSSNGKHMVTIHFPNKMHDTFIYVRIKPISEKFLWDNKPVGKIGSEDNQVFQSNSGLSFIAFYRFFQMHVHRGILCRHQLWLSMPKHVKSFVSLRSKHLRQHGVDFAISNKNIVYVQQVNVRVISRTEKNKKTKANAMRLRKQADNLSNEMMRFKNLFGTSINKSIPEVLIKPYP